MVKFLLCFIPCSLMYLVFLNPLSLAIELPKDLRSIMNITSEEDDVAYCMTQFKNCLNPQTSAPICALDAVTDTKKIFSNICEMIYTNCRMHKELWHFLIDDIDNCNGSLTNSTVAIERKKKTV